MTQKILLVDDEEDNLQLLTKWLVPSGYEVAFATSGEEAIRKTGEIRPDLIILDIMMPGMSGFEVCAELKKNLQTSHIPIIMVTALNDRESRLKGLETGADDFISKPVDKSEIILRTKSLLRVKEYEDFLKNHNELLARQVKERTAELESAYEGLKLAQSQLLEKEKWPPSVC